MPQMTCTCAVCGSTFQRAASAARPGSCCGPECLSTWRKAQTRERAGGWRNGTRTGIDGRVKVKVPGHPRADPNGYVYRYHLVVEQVLGRRLRPEEVVHHIDFDKSNDDPCNLAVFPSNAAHSHFHGMVRNGHIDRTDLSGTDATPLASLRAA